MKLLIDIGNSRIKWAALHKGKMGPGDSHPRPESLDNLTDFADQTWGKIKKPRAVVVSNVAGPDYASALTAWTQEKWQVEPVFLTAEKAAFGVHNAYVVPERLGPDRWASLIAARSRHKAPLFIIDAGTAVTIDVMTADGVHQGGLIIPGLEMMRRALLERTQDLRAATIAPARSTNTLLARDTRDGIDGGTLYTLVAVIDRVVADISAEMGNTPVRIITGGNAGNLTGLLHGDFQHIPELVLEGLAVVAENI